MDEFWSDVKGEEDNPIGSLKERIFTFFPTYDIMSPSGNKLATASLNFWKTKYTFKDAVTGKELAVLSRPFFRIFTDFWTFKISDREFFARPDIDPAVFILIAVFQTDRDNWDRDSVMSIKSALPTSPFYQLDARLELLKNEIETYRPLIEKVEPTETDLNIVDALVNEKLLEEEQVQLPSKEKWIMVGLNKLIPLLDDETLTAAQKYVLFMLIEAKVQEFRF